MYREASQPSTLRNYCIGVLVSLRSGVHNKLANRHRSPTLPQVVFLYLCALQGSYCVGSDGLVLDRRLDSPRAGCGASGGA